jgi:PAS domain S-box-containing protein
MRDYVKRLLVGQGYEVETVGDGLAALARIRDRSPDLVLTDVMMPGLDGLALLRELRADSSTRETPIILLSARAGEESRIEGLEAGADDYLIKPFSARELLARVEATLKLAQMRQEVARYEQALRVEAEATRSQISNILESITDAFVTFDCQWRYTYVNAQASSLLRKTREELLGKQVWEEVFPERVGSLSYHNLQRALNEQVSIVFEEFNPTLGIWFEAHVYPSPDGISIYFRDISDRKQAERALQESEAIARARAEELERLMEINPAALWIAHDPNCHHMTANQTAYELMRMKPGSVTTATPANGSYPFRFKQHRNGQEVPLQDLPMQKAIKTGQEILDEMEFVFEDGTVRYIYGRAVPLRNELGNIRGAIGAFIDITERKQAEQEREQLLKREQAARADSEAARSAAEAANRIKDEFLAVLSHELRSPLNPILGWSRLLQTKKFDAARTTQALATIERNAKLQAELIEDLLDVSRILRGKLSLNVAPVALTSTIQAAMETVRLAAEAKSIQMYTQGLNQRWASFRVMLAAYSKSFGTCSQRD